MQFCRLLVLMILKRWTFQTSSKINQVVAHPNQPKARIVQAGATHRNRKLRRQITQHQRPKKHRQGVHVIALENRTNREAPAEPVVGLGDHVPEFMMARYRQLTFRICADYKSVSFLGLHLRDAASFCVRINCAPIARENRSKSHKPR